MKKLLIVEDNQMMMTFLANYFTSSYQLELASSPSEALELIEANAQGYDLIISDFKSKAHQEYTMLKSVSSIAKWSNIPMIILTDEDKSLERLEALKLGANDTLSKPFNPKELDLRVAGMIDQSYLTNATINRAA